MSNACAGTSATCVSVHCVRPRQHSICSVASGLKHNSHQQMQTCDKLSLPSSPICGFCCSCTPQAKGPSAAQWVTQQHLQACLCCHEGLCHCADGVEDLYPVVVHGLDQHCDHQAKHPVHWRARMLYNKGDVIWQPVALKELQIQPIAGGRRAS